MRRHVTIYPKSSLQVVCLLGLSLMTGCSSQPELVSDFAPENYPILPAKFAEQGVASSLVTSEAFIGDDEFFISYESEDGLIFAGGNWSNRIDIAAVEVNTDGTYGGPYILPLDFQQRERWSAVPESPIRPRLLSSEKWDRFRDDLFASVLPRTEKTGVAMHFDNDDYFL
jgi:hypothetical protein